MNAEEKIAIRRSASGSMVNVTWKVGEDTVHWQVRVLGPTVASIKAAIEECRNRCAMLINGIEAANEGK